MHNIQESFDLVSLHDATLIKIDREGDSLSIFLTFAFLAVGHPDNPLADDSLVCLSPILRFVKFTKEEARVWDEDKENWMPHPKPLKPLNKEIMQSRKSDGMFILDGFHEAGWSEWRIWADQFMLTFDQSHPYHKDRPKSQQGG